VPVEKLDMLPFLDPAVLASSTLRSRKPAHRSARDSPLPELGVGSEKNSVFSAGELGVRWNGDIGKRRVLLAPPGRASPAVSRCSSVQSSRPAMTCRIWNFRGSDRSRDRK
jgi:hypothetical protein